MPKRNDGSLSPCILNKDGITDCPACDSGDALKDDPLFLPYRTLLGGRYAIGCRIGKGRRTVTYLAHDTKSPAATLAIKEYFPRDLAERNVLHVSTRNGCHEEFSNGLANFLLEYEMLKRVSHKNIVRAHGILKENGTAYLVMSYCGGTTLQQFARNRFAERGSGFFGREEALNIMRPILEALEELHGIGIVHCDVNANNIHLVPTGDGKDPKPVLLDFGSAQPFPPRGQLRPVTVTPGYSPPEQYDPRDATLGPEVDIYACGATLYYLLTGALPPDAPQRQRRDRIEPLGKKALSLPDNFANAVDQSLSLDPEDRPKRVYDFLKALGGSGAVVHAPAPPTIEVPTPPIRLIDKVVRALDSMVAPLLIGAVLIACTGFAFSSIGRDPRPPVATANHYTVPPSDYYLLRDVSDSPSSALYDAIEASILSTLRTNDSISGDRSSYAIFGSDVTNGGATLQPASEGDIVERLKGRSFEWLSHRSDFKRTTRFDLLFASIREALRNGDEGRKAFVFIISDGVPDPRGGETGCLGSSDLESFSGPRSKLAEVLSAPRVDLTLILSGGNPECGGFVARKWEEIRRGLLPSLAGRFQIVNLARYTGPDQVSAVNKELAKFLGNKRRAPCGTIRPVYDRLLDSQRAAFDARAEFSVDYFIQGHLGDGIALSISRAEILDSAGRIVGELDVVRRPQGEPVKEKASFNVFAGADRNGGEVREPLYFEFKNGFVPNAEEPYVIRVRLEQEQSCGQMTAEVRADPGVAVRTGEIRRKRMKILSVITFVLATAFSLCAWHYRKSHDENRRRSRLFRKFFIKAFWWWIIFFSAMSLILFILGIDALDYRFAVWLLGVATLWVCFMQYRKISSQSFRSAEPVPHEVLIVALESIVVPFLSLLLNLLVL